MTKADVDKAFEDARQAITDLRGLAEPARGGRQVDSAITDIAAALDAAINAVADSVDPAHSDNTAVSDFLVKLTKALEDIRNSA